MERRISNLPLTFIDFSHRLSVLSWDGTIVNVQLDTNHVVRRRHFIQPFRQTGDGVGSQQSIVDDITSAIFTCPEVYAKTRLWKEGIENLKKAIGRKLDYASFMLLKVSVVILIGVRCGIPYFNFEILLPCV
ncbi:hypothetical protein AVEN_130156-1 [Araneus ventricosus]|uniref:Uncharacterized protein n=1 Tax=Araneus ventricosus TaxID=182803 RepID=A0A4Y2TA56_ARAVE|nr:hypothetical protein AVEN_130156-1 [Araneus ventricosus]